MICKNAWKNRYEKKEDVFQKTDILQSDILFSSLQLCQCKTFEGLISMYAFLLIFGVKTGLWHCTTSSWVFHSRVHMPSSPWNAGHGPRGHTLCSLGSCNERWWILAVCRNTFSFFLLCCSRLCVAMITLLHHLLSY